MKKKIFLFLCLSGAFLNGNSMKFESLKVDHLYSPLGLDNSCPRFSWHFSTVDKSVYQSSYRILVGTDSLMVHEDVADAWDSGLVVSDSMFVTYKGKMLQPSSKYYWKVICKDSRGKSIVSDISSFETGKLSSDNWKGHWISDWNDKDYKNAPYFRKEFSVTKKLKSARVYIAAAGLFELYINGKKIGDHFLDPMFTRYDRRNLYVTFDITKYLKEQNAVGVLLGNGWYNHQAKAVWNFDKATWRDRPSFCMDIRLTYEDGSVVYIPTDLTWKTSSGELLSNNIYTGECYDSRQEKIGWSTSDYDDSGWNQVRFRGAPSTHIVSQQLVPIKAEKELSPVKVSELSPCKYVIDFGRNISGVSHVIIKGKDGLELTVKHGERLEKDGSLDLSNIDVYYLGKDDEPGFQTDKYILKDGVNVFAPRFSYKGFRYVELSASDSISAEDFSVKAYFIHTDVASVGKIHSSNTTLNKIWEATNNAYLSNLMGYPTDCPQREKNGWTGDAHFAIETALYNFDGITLYEKWLADHRDEQQPNGVLPDIIPTCGWGYGTENGVDWTSTIAIIPWNLYLFYGDSKPLFDCYQNIKRYVDYIDHNSPAHLTSWGRGDWVPVSAKSNKELTSSVYFYVDASILSKAAKLFGRIEDYNYYSRLAEQIKKAINDKYLDENTGIYASGSQTELSMPLYWGVVPENFKAKVAERLAENVRSKNFHLDVGVLGAKSILCALSENGFSDIAYKVAVQDTYPSWGWWIVNGATTLHENWDLKATRDISDNHMMFGEIGGWFYKALGGLYPDESKPGFRQFILRPNFVKELEDFEMNYSSVCGDIVSKWRWDNNRVIYDVVVPPNTTAILYLPDNIRGKKIKKLVPGSYSFKFSFL